MGTLQAFLLALVQGLTEFLPISSSAHLVLLPVVMEWQDQGLVMDIAAHLGSLFAVLFYFRHDLNKLSKGWLQSFSTNNSSNEDNILGIAISSKTGGGKNDCLKYVSKFDTYILLIFPIILLFTLALRYTMDLKI